MYNIKKEELSSLLQKMRQIRQTFGEMIAFLEHLMQMQGDPALKPVNYNPDDYLEQTDAHTRDFDLAHREFSETYSYKQQVEDF